MADQNSVILERANSALIARDFAYAEKMLLNLLRQNEESLEALTLLGTVYLRSNRLEKALSVYKKLAENNPETPKFLTVLE